MGLVPRGPVHRPYCGKVAHGEGETKLAEAVAALLADQIALHKPWDGDAPLRTHPCHQTSLLIGEQQFLLGPQQRHQHGQHWAKQLPC